MSGDLPGVPVLTTGGGSSSSGRGSLSRALVELAAVVALGVACGAVWWWLAPLARADVSGSSVFLQGHQELQAAQDGWFVVVLGALGVVTATAHGWRSSGHRVVRAGDQARELLLLTVAMLIASLVAWRTGAFLGPAGLAQQVADGSAHPLTPLELHSAAALLVGPFLFAFTAMLAALLGAGGRGR